MARIRVALDVQPARRSGMTGHGYYVKGLLEGLRSEEGIEIVELAPPSGRDLGTLGRFVWDQFKLPSLARRAQADVLHSTCFSVPRAFRGARVATIHDLSLRLFPQNMKGFSGWFLRSYVPSTFRRANEIIAISKATKHDAMRILDLAEERITVVYEAGSLPAGASQPTFSDDFLGRHRLVPGRYFLFVGTIEPRKNLAFLVRALEPLIRKELDLRLVIAGKVGWQAEDVKAEIERLGLRDNVLFTGYVSDDEKAALYRSAALFCFPSLYEGFGLPVLEAAGFGAPLAVADNSSLPEVVGHKGLVLPLQEEVWASAAAQVLADPDYRAELGRMAAERAREFSWDRTARETVAVYRKAIERNPV